MARVVLDVPRRLVGALLDEVGWLVVLLPVWGLSLLAWLLSPWIFGAFVVAVVCWTVWALRRTDASSWAVAGMAAGLALLQLVPVLTLSLL
ncbi:hypothetical protein [Pseudokineococcus sp. 1T1Z-3]|uniref:hypothetical protein n=1 Tax=Pseudokineococcus sp. 1T1Z-3 TaxID=3132745 RepID=UPI0030983F77